MSEIEKGHPIRTIDSMNDQACNLKQEGETSLDSQMEDTPANYNLANQRVMPKQFNRDGVTIPEEGYDTLL